VLLFLLACGASPGETGTPEGLTLSGPVVCADPTLRESLGPWEAVEISADEPVPGAGAVVGDFDGDGILDLFLPDLESCSLLVGVGDGTFIDRTDTLPPLSPCDAWGGSTADADGDGDLDILVTRLTHSNALLLNDGDGVFTDGTEAAGLSGIVRASMSATWADMDRDGDLDVFVSNHSPNPVDPDAPNNPDEDVSAYWGAANTLLEHRDGLLVDVSDRLSSADRYGYTFMAAWQDLDGDRRPDLYILNDFGDTWFSNRYLHNSCNGGDCTLVDASEASALDLRIDAMGMGIGDLNGDRLPDLAITDNYRLHLLISEGGTWYDASLSMGLAPDETIGQRNAWGGELVDVDLDGDLDFLATFGPTERAIREGKYLSQPDGLWLLEDGRFTPAAAAWGFDQADIGRGFVVADLNRDGHPDVIKRRYKGGPTLALVSRCSAASWLTVQLVGGSGNTHAIGAEVVVVAGGREQVRWIHAGSTSLASGGPPEALFGLGDAEEVERIVVRWPGSGVSVFTGIPVNRIVTLSR
jgi:hypothetical protein